MTSPTFTSFAFASFLGLTPGPSVPPVACALGKDAATSLAQSKTLLEQGDGVGALLEAEEGLEFAPDQAELLDQASRAASAAADKDKALWYTALAAEAVQSTAGTQPSKETLLRLAEFEKRIGELDTLSGKDRAVIAAYAADLLALGNDCSNRKYYLNAVELLTRCRATPLKAGAEAALEKIYGNKKAVEALLASGFDVPLKMKKKGSPATIAKEDKKHSTWEQAWQIKGDCYTVITDMNKDLADQMSSAMEQMNGYYRKVFHVKEHGGGDTARVTIRVYAKRSEFDEHEHGPDADIAGFFVPNVNVVATYDPRSTDWPLSELWSTLFHEASHQFTHLISADLIPGWLNEGTASYFEGARLLPNGTVETNLVPEGRLRDLKTVIEAGKPSLKDVVGFYQPGSYEGEYYPVGWSLVYFFNNYEDDKCERVYQQAYRDYMGSYKSGGKHDVVGRFVDFFVTKPKQPGVASFEDFEKRWKTWMLDLHALYFGGADKADLLVARARKEVQNKKYEAAIESYRWALRKRPGDAVAELELSDALNGLKQSDAALLAVHEALDAARAIADPKAVLPGSDKLTGEALTAACNERAQKLAKDLSEKHLAADARFLTGAAGAARAYADAKLPLSALRLLDQSCALIGQSADLVRLRKELVEKTGADTRRWRRLPLDPDGTGGLWELGERVVAGKDTMTTTGDKPAFAYYKGDLPDRFRVEVKIDMTKVSPELGMSGFLFGVNDQSLRYFAMMPDGSQIVGTLGKKGWDDELSFAAPESEAPTATNGALLAMEIDQGHVDFFSDGRKVGEKTWAKDEIEGMIGLVSQGGTSVFSELRVRY